MMDLLPNNATKQERALSMSASRVGSVPVVLRDLWSPWTCPVEILPWLAWSLSVDDWDVDWTEQQKRGAIASSVEVHRRKGTVGAVRRALQAIGYEVQIREWVEGAYTFSVYIDGTSSPVEESAFIEAERLALTHKNVRSHLATVGTFIQSAGSVDVVSATLDGETTEILPFYVGTLESPGAISILSGMQDVVSTMILPPIPFPEIEISGKLFLPSFIRSEIIVELN